MLLVLCRRLAAGTVPTSLLGRSLQAEMQAEMLSHGSQRAAVCKAPRRTALHLHSLIACVRTECLTACVAYSIGLACPTSSLTKPHFILTACRTATHLQPQMASLITPLGLQVRSPQRDWQPPMGPWQLESC